MRTRGRYAGSTSVPFERSRAEIEDLLHRYGDRIKFNSYGCWQWTGYIAGDGYGYIGITKTRQVLAHRLVYQAFRGPLTPGLVIDHICRHRSCVNPKHMEEVTRGENVRRGMHPSQIAHRNRTCVRSHPMTPQNTYTSPKGQRHCRACRGIREMNRGPRPSAPSAATAEVS